MEMNKESVAKFIKDEDGLTTVEYAVAGALVAAAVAAAFMGLGGAVADNIRTLTTIVSTPPAGGGGGAAGGAG